MTEIINVWHKKQIGQYSPSWKISISINLKQNKKPNVAAPKDTTGFLKIFENKIIMKPAIPYKGVGMPKTIEDSPKNTALQLIIAFT